jgi:hypothetical protein
MARKSTIIGFAIPTVLVALLHLLRPHIELNKSILNILFGWPFLGLILINVLLFVTSLCGGFGGLKKSRMKGELQNQKDQEDEKALERLLQGDSVVNCRMPSWARIGIAICIGLIAGSVLGFVLNRIITQV